MNNLATLLVDSEDSNDAIQLFDASLSVLNDYYKSAHPLILVTVENYASYLYTKGNIEDSENLYAQANEIREALYYIDKNIPGIEEDLVQISEWEKIAALLKSFSVII
jgi:tetratricopeptide (TPR) repeat protein